MRVQRIISRGDDASIACQPSTDIYTPIHEVSNEDYDLLDLRH